MCFQVHVGGRWWPSLTQAVASLVNAVWSHHLVIAASGGEICIRVMLVSRFIYGLLSLGHIYRTNIRGRATLVFICNRTKKPTSSLDIQNFHVLVLV